MKKLLLVATGAACVFVAQALWMSMAPSEWRWRNPSPFVWLLGGVPLQATYTPTPIKSVQTVTVTFNGSQASNQAALNPALTSLANSVLTWEGTFAHTSGGFYSSAGFLIGTLSSVNAVTANTGSGNPLNGSYYRGVVIEFLSNFVKSRACNTISIPNGSDSATNAAPFSPAVTVAKTWLTMTGGMTTSTIQLNGAADGEGQAQMDITLTNTTTATAFWQWNASTSRPQARQIGYCYVEFR